MKKPAKRATFAIEIDETWQIDVEKGNLLQIFIENKIPVHHSCDGQGSCGTCLIEVCEGSHLLTESTDIEKEMAVDRDFSSKERLSCQSYLKPLLPTDGKQVLKVNLKNKDSK